MAVARDRLFWDQQDAEAEIVRLKAEVENWKQLSASLCDWGTHYMKRCGELSRGRNTVVADRAAVLAELPLLPTTAQKRAVAKKHGIDLHRVNTLVREAGLNSPARWRQKFSRDSSRLAVWLKRKFSRDL